MMKYEFHTTDGKTCCSSDDITLLCASCRAAAMTTDDPPTDPRLVQMARFRDQLRADALTAALLPSSSAHLTPPDPYRIAIAKMKETP
jgi:hypothetical protein